MTFLINGKKQTRSPSHRDELLKMTLFRLLIKREYSGEILTRWDAVILYIIR